MLHHLQIKQCDKQFNNREDKIQVIISINVEKAFDKIQQPFIIKTFTKVGIEGTHLNIIKAIYNSQHNSQWCRAESLLTKFRNKTRMSTLTTSIQHSIGNPSDSNQTRKRKGIQIGKGEVKLSLFADDMILYVANPKVFTQKLLILINEFSKVIGYRIKIQKSVAFVYTNNEISERESKIKISFKWHQKKYIGNKPDQGSETLIY